MSQVASEFGISRKTLYEWISDTNKPDFMAAYDKYITELDAYFQDMFQGIGDGSKKGNLQALIFRAQTVMGQKIPEYLVTLKKEIKHETQATQTQVRDELKKILNTNASLISFLLEHNSGSETAESPGSVS